MQLNRAAQRPGESSQSSAAASVSNLYTYKYTVAASLPGFKVESPTYAEGITAAAFQELLKNPIDMDFSKGKHAKEGTTFLERLIEPVVKKTIDKMMDVRKVAE